MPLGGGEEMNKIIALAIAGSVLATPAHAERRLRFEGVAEDGTTLRFNKGVATLDRACEQGAIQITPLEAV
jgi:hypothetical protein